MRTKPWLDANKSASPNEGCACACVCGGAMMPAFRFHILLHTPHAVDLGYSTDSQVGCSRVAPVCWCLLEIVCCRGFTSNLQAVGTLAGLCSVRSLPIWWSAHGQLGGSWAEPTYTLQWRGLRPLGVWLSFPRAVHTLLHRVQSLAGVRSGSGALLNAGNNGRGRHSLNRMYTVEGYIGQRVNPCSFSLL